MLKESAQKICALTGASLLAGDPSQEMCSFTNDTRAIKQGSTFVCFVGEKRDGNDFTISAIEAGAKGVVMCREAHSSELMCAKSNGAVLLRAKDDDAYAFLQTLARAYRKHEGWLTVGVTGSVGKTTTRQMLKATLSARYKTFSNEGNFNSVIGVPLTILNAPEGQEVFVCEMGMDHAGEIDAISSVALPNLGCITNIGTAHIGILGSQENIARAKAEMVRWISPATSTCSSAAALSSPALSASVRLTPALFLDGNDDYSAFIAQTFAQEEGIAVELLTTNNQGSNTSTNSCLQPYARLQKIVLTQNGTTRFTYLSHAGIAIEVACPLLGEHMALDALFALAIAEYVGCEPHEAARQIEGMQATSLRAEMKTLPGGARFIDDSYNANPASMMSALNLLGSLSCSGKKIAVLGEMGELGDKAKELHEQIGAYAGSKHFSTCIFVGGENARSMHEAAKKEAAKKEDSKKESVAKEDSKKDVDEKATAKKEAAENVVGKKEPAEKNTTATEILLVAHAEDARQALSSILESDQDIVLVKGSRFMALDVIAKEMNATC